MNEAKVCALCVKYAHKYLHTFSSLTHIILLMYVLTWYAIFSNHVSAKPFSCVLPVQPAYVKLDET